MRVALAGAGNVGTAVARLLSSKGHEIVAVASRSKESARAAAELLDSTFFPMAELPPVDLFLIGASESGIETVDELIAPRLVRGAYVWHLAGAFGPSILRRSLEADAIACALHPVQAVYSVSSGIERLPGSAWGVTCSDPGAEERMIELIDQDLGGFPVVIPESLRPLWHAAAVITSNGVAALMAVGEALLSDIGVADPARVLGPLAAGTVENARLGGGGSLTLTGPVVRGETETLDRHVAALAERRPEQAERYRAVTALIVRVARDTGRIDEALADTIMRRLGS